MPRVFVRHPDTKELVRIIDDELGIEIVRQKDESEAAFKARAQSEMYRKETNVRN